MREDGQKHFEMPKQMRTMAEASFEQARKAFENFIEGAQVAAHSLSARNASVRAGAKDAGAMAFSCAEKNIQASLDYAEALLHAKDLNEAMRVHRDYVQAQMRVLAEQASEMGQIVNRTAMDAVKPKN
jgi:hypothetical protein